MVCGKGTGSLMRTVRLLGKDRPFRHWNSMSFLWRLSRLGFYPGLVTFWADFLREAKDFEIIFATFQNSDPAFQWKETTRRECIFFPSLLFDLAELPLLTFLYLKSFNISSNNQVPKILWERWDRDFPFPLRRKKVTWEELSPWMMINIQLHGCMCGEQLSNHSPFWAILACAYPSWKSLVTFHPLKSKLGAGFSALTRHSVGGFQE